MSNGSAANAQPQARSEKRRRARLGGAVRRTPAEVTKGVEAASHPYYFTRVGSYRTAIGGFFAAPWCNWQHVCLWSRRVLVRPQEGLPESNALARHHLPMAGQLLLAELVSFSAMCNSPARSASYSRAPRAPGDATVSKWKSDALCRRGSKRSERRMGDT